MIILPARIYLTALAELWRITYHQADRKLVLVELPRQSLVIMGAPLTERAVVDLLKKWIKLKAQVFLKAYFQKLNKKVNSPYKKLNIIASNIEWGYCSPKGVISLNYKLIFLPRTLVRHLIIHELCHVRYLNHSRRFWHEVKKYDKSWKKNDTLLYEGNRYIPNWIIY